MKVLLAEINNKPVYLELKDGEVYINDLPEPIRNLSESELEEFQNELDGLPTEDREAHSALTNSVRAAFLAKLLGKAADDESISHITDILDHVHYDVLQYLGEAGE